MENPFPLMTEDYRRRHYKNGVFARMKQLTGTVSVLVYLFMGAVFVGGSYGTWWVLRDLERYKEADLFGFGLVLAGVFFLFALVGLGCIVVSVRRHLRGVDEWKARCAKESGSTVADMEEFERQALSPTSQVLCLVDPVKKTVQGQEDGILTRDFVMLTLNSPCVLKLDDLTVACLVQLVVKAGKGTDRVGIPYLNVGLMGKNGASVLAECSKTTGPALIALLKERCPGLDTAGGAILSGDTYNELYFEKFGKKNQPVHV